MGLSGCDGYFDSNYVIPLEDVEYFAADKRYRTEVVHSGRFCLGSEPCYNQYRWNDGAVADERHHAAIPKLWRYEHDVRSFCCRYCFTNIRMDNEESNRRR